MQVYPIKSVNIRLESIMKPSNDKRSARKVYIKAVILLTAIFFFPLTLPAQTIDQAVDQAVSALTTPIYSQTEGKRFLIQIINQHTQQSDAISDDIETALFFSLEKNFPDKKRISMSDSTVGISSRGTLFINGTYEKIGNKIQVEFKVLKGLASGELIAQARVSYTTGRYKESTLVAVLDIESEDLNKQQTKIYSEIFRSALNNTGVFNLASSADIDKMDPESIQQASGCTRDECATIIGQQLGVDRVISTTVIQRTTQKYFLAGKLIDIKDGSIIQSAIVNHHGDKNNLDYAFKQLAKKLTASESTTTSIPTPTPRPQAVPLFKETTPVQRYEAQKEEPVTYYSNKSSNAGSAVAIGYGIPTSMSVSSLKKTTTCSTCSGEEEDMDYTADEDPEGWVLRWTVGKRRGFNFGLSFGQYRQKFTSADLTENEAELYHTGLGLDFLYGGSKTLTIGGGFGMYQTNIICDDCFYEAGIGFGLSPLKVGYNWGSVGFRFDSHVISSNSKRTYTLSNKEYEEEYAWTASIVTFSLLFIF